MTTDDDRLARDLGSEAGRLVLPPRPPRGPPRLRRGACLMTTDDDRLPRDLASEAGRLLLALRAAGGEPDALRKAGDLQSHVFLAAQLSQQRPGDAVLSEEGR